ncbi:MAG: hypothetical protein ACJZ00_05130 [Cytophagales bacterium]|nr:MAG: hypothetical protein CND58_04790 [Rhodothermaeota bacterium MED-G16]
MSKTSTNLDIIKYIYNELEEPNKNKIKIQSLLDTKTKDQIESFDEIKSCLDNFFVEPSEEIINKIKAYSLQSKSEYFV